MTEWDRFPLCAQPGKGGCGLHVLYITDICHAGVPNSNPCETVLPSDRARRRQEVQKEASVVLTLVCVDLRSQKVRAEVGSRMQGFSVT